MKPTERINPYVVGGSVSPLVEFDGNAGGMDDML